MNKDISELVFILDKSGSMSGKEEDVVGGFNSTIKQQKQKDYQTLVTTVLFSDNSKTIHDRKDINKVKDMKVDDFVPNGCTALIDALGETIKHIKTVQRYVENKPKKTLFVIMTDGLENASHRYSSNEVKKMIKQQKTKDWEFIFLGANIDSIETAKTYGIDKSRAVDFSTNNFGDAFCKIGKAMNLCLEPTLSVDRINGMMKEENWKQ